MSVPPDRLRDVVGPADEQPGDGEPNALAGPKYQPGRFSVLLIDNVTGKATRVDVRPLTIEGILRTNRRDRPLLVGFLLVSLLAAARKLWPEFEPETRLELSGYPLEIREKSGPSVPFMPRWRRHQTNTYEDDEGGI